MTLKGASEKVFLTDTSSRLDKMPDVVFIFDFLE